MFYLANVAKLNLFKADEGEEFVNPALLLEACDVCHVAQVVREGGRNTLRHADISSIAGHYLLMVVLVAVAVAAPGIGAEILLALLLAVTIWYVYWLRARVGDVGVCVFGACYTGLQLSGLLLIRMSYVESGVPEFWGGVLVLIIFASIWFNDAGAYVIGSKIGKHKLAPRTSPNKSWEGFIAGLIVSMCFWCILLAVPGVQVAVWQCLLFGLVCGLTSVLGDLCESRIKRSVGFKDSGTIMPGHGGLFDRCDSLMPTAVVAAILLFGFGCLPGVPML